MDQMDHIMVGRLLQNSMQSCCVHILEPFSAISSRAVPTGNPGSVFAKIEVLYEKIQGTYGAKFKSGNL